MSGRALDLTQRQVRALCEGAKKAGYAAVIKIGNTLVWLVPEERAIPDEKKQVVDETEDFRL
jgi:hypothetical protein